MAGAVDGCFSSSFWLQGGTWVRPIIVNGACKYPHPPPPPAAKLTANFRALAGTPCVSRHKGFRRWLVGNVSFHHTS